MLHNGGRIVGQDENHYFVRIANPGKGRYPSAEEAKEILAEAELCNPGQWGDHSRTAAHCAEKIALYSGLCPEKAYVLGLLHDIGRKFGKRHLGHVSDGYSYMMKLDYPDAARICLTHSFNEMKIEGYVGDFDTTEEETELIRTKLQEAVPDDYDLLIQLCDAISGSEGVMDIIDRMSDVKRRYGDYDQGKWNKNLELKEHFEKRMNRNLYEAVEKDTFHNHSCRKGSF
ncbi:MAG: HD domain-containing protein [Clostridia bacterium]|nr:HD domain-containing protein [Clostridia bacterium]